MSALVDWFRDPAHRAYVYRVLGAIGVAMVAAGLATDGQTQVVLLVVGNLLGVGGNGLATGHTSTKPDAR